MNKFMPKKELIYLTFLKHEHIVELKDYFIEEDSGLLCLVYKAVFLIEFYVKILGVKIFSK